MAPPDDMPDEVILDLLGRQVDRYNAIVARLAGNGVQAKTWCITAVGAISALAVNNNSRGLFGVALAILLLFGFLDVFYLRLERRFREGSHHLVRRVAQREVQSMRELFTNRPPPAPAWGIWSVITSGSIWPFYLVAGALLVTGILTS